jgi:hypothetical protein
VPPSICARRPSHSIPLLAGKHPIAVTFDVPPLTSGPSLQTLRAWDVKSARSQNALGVRQRPEVRRDWNLFAKH